MGREMVVIVKILTALDEPTAPEAMLLLDLENNVQLINLVEIGTMTEEERLTDEYLLDLKALLEDPKMVKVVERIADLMKFGECIRHPFAAENFVTLEEWYPNLRPGFLAPIKLEYSERYERLVAPFRGRIAPGWTWHLQGDPETLRLEQSRLIYALSSAMVGLALGGIVERLYATPAEKLSAEQMGAQLHKAINEELLLDLETEGLIGIKLKDDK